MYKDGYVLLMTCNTIKIAWVSWLGWALLLHYELACSGRTKRKTPPLFCNTSYREAHLVNPILLSCTADIWHRIATKLYLAWQRCEDSALL